MKKLLIVATLSITVAAVIKKVKSKSNKPYAEITVDTTEIQKMINDYLEELNTVK